MYSKSTYTVIENNAWDMHFLLYQHQRRISYQEVKNKQQTWFKPNPLVQGASFCDKSFFGNIITKAYFLALF